MLMLNGELDNIVPLEAAARPFFEQLGTRTADKKLEMSSRKKCYRGAIRDLRVIDGRTAAADYGIRIAAICRRLAMIAVRISSPVSGIAARAAFLGLVMSVGACSGGRDSGGAAGSSVTGAQPPPPPPPRPSASPEPRPPAVDPPPQPPVAQLICASCKKIAFTSSRDGNDEIYSVNADGTGLARLTDDPAHDDQAAWSPDGQRIAFTSSTGDDSKLVVMNADGSNVVRHSLPHSVFDPTWSPDGSRITYAARSALSNTQDIWMVDADGGWPLLLFSLAGWEAHPSWSPDGAELAVVSDWFAYDFVFDVLLVDPDGAGFAPLTDGNIFDHLDYLWPSWSPDGARIALTLSSEIGRDEYLAYVGVMNRDGSGLTPLIEARPWSKSSWSPDGSMITFTSGSAGAYDVSWVKADGSAWGTIVANGWNPAWQH
jgi:dipeptidyl aminopeptidase/acylaminoacyl peptidase